MEKQCGWFKSLCIMAMYLTEYSESFNWTAQPTNPTPAIKGQDVSLAWQYSLTADELLQSQTLFFISWKKLNQSTSNYDQIATKGFLKAIGLYYQEPRSLRITINKNDQATLHIKDVRREDEGTYKIEFILQADGTVLAEQRVNFTVLGVLCRSIHYTLGLDDRFKESASSLVVCEGLTGCN